MYRAPYTDSYRYKCGCYTQSHGEKCAHNTVDGPTASRFVMSSLRKRLGTPKLREKLQQRLRSLAEQEAAEPLWEQELSAKRTELSQLDADLEKVARNLALADDQQQHKAIAKVFGELNASYPKTHPTMKPFDFQACRGDAASNLIRAERRRVGGQNISVAISSRASLQSAISARIFGAPSSSRATNIAN